MITGTSTDRRGAVVPCTRARAHLPGVLKTLWASTKGPAGERQHNGPPIDDPEVAQLP
jgi:hypothetical protein